MKEFITSDLHFGHNNIMKFCPKTRPYSSVAEMDEALIRAWNSEVDFDDRVFILGDISFHQSTKTTQILQRLTGTKILISGNHDSKLLKDARLRDCFAEIHSYHEITRDKRHIVMFHYPMLSWNRMGHGALHFHGHRHGTPTGQEHLRCMDVGLDATGRVVMPLDEAIDRIKGNGTVGHHD